MRKFTALLLAILMLLLMEMSWAQAAEDEEVQGTEVQEDQVVAIVNGEEILLSTLETIEAQYESLYEDRGYDLEEESVRAHLSDTALSALIEALLIEQDMRAQGFYDFDEEEEAAFEQLGQQAYDACLQELESAYLASMNVEDTQDELTDSDTYQAQTDAEAYAVRMASQVGYSAETLAQNYRDQAALEAYQASLMEGEEITEEDVAVDYEERVAASKEAYENDVAAYEEALYYNEEVWYAPAGYRSVLQILIATDEEGETATLESAADTIAEIYARLEEGADFTDLIAEYGEDTNFDNPDFYETGYQVHQESIVWEDAFIEAAFSEEMTEPGDVSEPFESDLGVHILYYLEDVPGGAVELNDVLSELLSMQLYQTRLSEKLQERVDELAEAAEVELFA